MTQYKITLLSPVHIGSGEKLSRNIDYFSDETGTYLLDADKLFETLSPEQIDDVTNSRDIMEFMSRNGFNARDYAKLKISPQQVTASEINQCIKNGFEKPYIPGSSLKGALRTVIARHLFKEKNIRFDFKPGKREWAYSGLNKQIFGKDPNHDFLRGLLVTDSTFEASAQSLLLTKVYVMGRNNVLAVKLTHRDNPGSEMKIYAEFLKAESSSPLKIKIDDFLFTPRFMKELEIDQRSKDALWNLREIANTYAKEKIQQELKFYDGQYKLKPVFQFYKNLLNTASNLDEKSFILNLGWGTGWNFKTGGYISKTDLDRVRRRFGLGKIILKCPLSHRGKDLKNNRNKRNFYCYKCKKEYPYEDVKHLIYPFPKSRKILFNFQDSPFAVPGWVLISAL